VAYSIGSVSERAAIRLVPEPWPRPRGTRAHRPSQHHFQTNTSVTDDATTREDRPAPDPGGISRAVPEAWLAAIVDSSDDAIIGKTLDGIIQSWNDGARRIFGYEAAEIVGRTVYTLIPPELHSEEPEILRRLLDGERMDHYETVRLRKDGTRIDVSLSVSPIRDARGKIVGAAKVARDVTEAIRFHRAERELLDQLQELTSELEQQVAEAQALQEEVEQANSDLVEALANADDARRLAEEATPRRASFWRR
jgi:PAS domain S-box-containing protein